MNVIEYVTEEVRRQGHDVYAIDGIERVAWMLDAWALVLREQPQTIDLSWVGLLGSRVEPGRNPHGIRQCGVRVGWRICPSPLGVSNLLSRLLNNQQDMTPLEFYKEFEEIHPFVDGNGRTGKILLNWKNGTLLNPIFPPADLWGEPIQNP